MALFQENLTQQGEKTAAFRRVDNFQTRPDEKIFFCGVTL